MGTYLGLDVGATHSRWAWSDGQVHEAPGGIQAGLGIERAAGELAQLLAQIWSLCPDRTPDLTAIGMAGAGDRAVAKELEARIGRSGLNWPLVVVGDVVVAAAAALGSGPGVALWSGTGSFAVGRDAAGKLHRVGGRGHLIGDAGSAYDIVRSAGVAAAKAIDGTGPATHLTGLLCKAFGCGAPARLGAAMQGTSPAQIASACPAIVDCAARGDKVARGVLRAGAGGLAEQAAAAARRSGLDPESADLFLGGGLLEHASPFVELLATELRTVGFQQPPVAVRGGAAVGGVALAEALHHKRAPMCHWVERLGTA